jgi:hypothetical protein
MSKKISLIVPGKIRPNIIPLFKSWVKRRVEEEKKKWEEYASANRRYGYLLYDDYGDEYEEEMEQLRRFYGGCFPRSGGSSFHDLDDDDDDDWDNDNWNEYDDYYVGDDGEIIFPSAGTSQTDPDTTLRPGQMHRSAQDMDDYWNKMSKFNEKGKKKHTKHRGKRGKGGAKVIDINEPYNNNFIDYLNESKDENSGDALENCKIYFYEDYHDKFDRIEFNSLYEFDQYCKEFGFSVPAYVAEQIAYSPINHCCLNPVAKEQGVLEIMREETYGEMFYEACESSELSDT